MIDDEFKDPINFINSDGNEARQKALTVFRNGTPKDKKKAVQILSHLGEVEKF